MDAIYVVFVMFLNLVTLGKSDCFKKIHKMEQNVVPLRLIDMYKIRNNGG